MNHRYPVILLDADDTLLDFDRAETAAVSGTLARAGLDPTPAVLSRYKEINRRSWEALERGECQKDEMLWRRFQTLFRENGLDFDPREANRDYRARLSRCAFVLPGALELCRELKAEGRVLFILTNGAPPVQRSRLALAGLMPLLDGVVISEEVGAEKPHPAFFAAAERVLAPFSAGDCVMLGDSQTSDMPGARAWGARTVWFDPKNKPQTGPWDARITALDQFPAALNALEQEECTHD